MKYMARPAKPNGAVAERNPKRTRERILSAALQEFAANGFAGARVDAIARRAAINKRMLYHYFGDKEHLSASTEGNGTGYRLRAGFCWNPATVVLAGALAISAAVRAAWRIRCEERSSV